MGTGQGGAQPGPFAPGIGQHGAAGNGTYAGGTGAPAGFQGVHVHVASPYQHTTDGARVVPEAQLTSPATPAFNFRLALRIAAAMLSVISCSLVILAKKDNDYVSIKYMRLRSSQFLVSMGAIAVVYKLLQILFSCLERAGAITFMSGYAGTVITFLLDQALAYLVFSASTLAADDAAAVRFGEGADDGKGCTSEWSSLCVQYEAGASMGFFASAALVLLAFISVSRFAKHFT